MSRLREIYAGWKNVLFASPQVKQIARERVRVCIRCEHLNALNLCSFCYCPHVGKAHSPESRCPLNKWKDGWGNSPQEEPLSPRETPRHPEQLFWDEQTQQYTPVDPAYRDWLGVDNF